MLYLSFDDVDSVLRGADAWLRHVPIMGVGVITASQQSAIMSIFEHTFTQRQRRDRCDLVHA